MKKLALLIFAFLFTGAFAQTFTIENKTGNILYLDHTNILIIKVEGYDSTAVIGSSSIFGTLTGENGKYFVNLDQARSTRVKEGDKLEITVFVEKEDGNYMLGSQSFEVKRKSNFEMSIGNFRTGDKVTAADIDAMENMTVYSDDAGGLEDGNGFKVISFQCLVVSKEGPAEGFAGVGSHIAADMKMHFKKWQNGSRILFDDIILENEKGERKMGSRMMLIFSEGRGVYVRAFDNKELFTIDELLKLENLDAISKSSGEIFTVLRYALLFVPKTGQAEAYFGASNQLSKAIKAQIEAKLKPGDKILLDDIIYQKPDGTEGTCAPVRIIIL